MKIEKIKIPWFKPFLGDEEIRMVQDAVESTWISSGPYVDQFEDMWAKKHNIKHCLTTNNGTSALHLVLAGLDIKPKDEIIVPGFGFLAAANMVLAMKAKPVFCDIDEKTWCLDVQKASEKITPRTKVIIVVHPYGNMADMNLILRLARKHHLIVIEDAAQAMFSRYDGILAGTLGDFGCFSFQATKTITMGEGGCVVTNRTSTFKRLELIRNHGMSKEKRYWHSQEGFNFRLTNYQAAMGVAQIKKIPTIISLKNKINKTYQRILKNKEGIGLQSLSRGVNPVLWAFTVYLDPKIYPSRDALIRFLLKKGIETRPGFYPPSLMPLYQSGPLPVAERVSKQLISLPSFITLDESQMMYICQQIEKFKK